jgi:hypothetical protein
MKARTGAANCKQEQGARYAAEFGECLAQIALIRRDMKNTDAEIRRLEASTRRRLNHIRVNLHVEKLA